MIDCPMQILQIEARMDMGEHPKATIREVLSWFGFVRRNRRVLREIYDLLSSPEYSIGTVPALNKGNLDSTVVFVCADLAEEWFSDVPTELTYRVGRLPLAYNRPVYLLPDDSVQKAILIMLERNFSQLPVMADESTVKGIFSWKSLAKKQHFGNQVKLVSEAVDKHQEVRPDDSLFDVIRLIDEHECVLLRDEAGKITSIITAYDIAHTYGQLGGPFLLVGEIEFHVRRLIEQRFSSEEIHQAIGSSRIHSVDDMTVGEYIRLLENEDRWLKFGVPLDRVAFIQSLDTVRQIRNDVMHFDPEGIDEGDVNRLREFLRLLRELSRLTAQSASASGS